MSEANSLVVTIQGEPRLVIIKGGKVVLTLEARRSGLGVAADPTRKEGLVISIETSQRHLQNL